tara:strand:- start:145 stop:414 length:270 start_codon:yes stop_codon:yes gene_type:complete
MTNWLSNKWNLIGIYTLCSFAIGYILYNHNLTFTELLVVYAFMGVCTLVVYIMGIGRGLFLATLMRHEIDGFLEGLRDGMKIKDDGEIE